MKTVIIGALAALLLIVSAVDASAASRGKRFHDGFDNPSQLAVAVQTNLAMDPTGTTMLNRELCAAPHWSCASPKDYLVVIRQYDPNAVVNGEPLTRVDQLPAFFRKLVIRKPPSGKYWMACMTKAVPTEPTASGYAPMANCVLRAFHAGETAWVDPDTGKTVLAKDCTNPVGRPEKLTGCVYLYYDTNTVQYRDSEVHTVQYGPTDVSGDDCTALLRAGESEWESPFVERCPYDPTCTYAGSDAFMGRENRRKTGSHPASNGRNILRLPAVFAEKGSPYRIFLCLKRVDGTGTCGVGIPPERYLPDKETGTKVAIVYYTEADALAEAGAEMKAFPNQPQPWIPYWSFNIVRDCPLGQ